MKKKKDETAAPKKQAPRFHMEMEGGLGGISLLACGVRQIEEYSDEALTLKITGGRMHLKGLGLCLTVFENKTVEVRGRLLEVSFSYGRD